jgi:hypothetical protein
MDFYDAVGTAPGALGGRYFITCIPFFDLTLQVPGRPPLLAEYFGSIVD